MAPRLRSPLARVRLGVLLAITWISTPALAQDISGPASQILFEQGRQLMIEERYSEACEKFQESYELEAGVGTLLNLALCHERLGKVGSAYVEYNDALAQSIRAQDTTRAELARQRLAELEPRLSRLMITVPDGQEQGTLTIELDGTKLGAAALGVPIPIDLGRHVVTVSSATGEREEVVVTVDGEGQTVNVALPHLGEAPSALESPPITARGSVPPATRPASPPRESKRNRGTRWSIAGGATAGVAGLAVIAGTYFGVNAVAAWQKRNRHCEDGGCDAEAIRAGQRAKDSAWLANGFFVLSGVSGGASVYLWVRANAAAKQSANGVGTGAPLEASSTTIGVGGSF